MKKLALALAVVFMIGMFAGCSSGSPSSSAAPSSTAAPASSAAPESSSQSQAEKTVDYPKSQITITVPPAPGGGTDLLVRAMAPVLKDVLGQNVVVVNKPGAGCAIGFAAGAKDKPDGYYITALVPELLAVPQVSTVDFTYKDYKPISCVNSTYGTLTVAADAPYNTVQEFVDYCKENPGTVRFSNSGIGGNWHFLAAAFAEEAGIDVVHVPFDGGGPSAVALAGGHVEATTVSLQELEVHINSGNVKPLCVFSPERNPAFPDVPTAAECGYPDIILTIFRGFGVPKDTPDEIVAILDEAFQKVLEDPSVTEFMDSQHFTKDYRDGADFMALMDRESEIYETQAAALGLKS